MTETKADDPLAAVRAGMNVHHGKTPAAWVGALTSLVGFFVGGIGLVLGPNWLVFWIGFGIVVVALIATAILRAAGMGAKGISARNKGAHGEKGQHGQPSEGSQHNAAQGEANTSEGKVNVSEDHDRS